jgi:hypothetical protein
MVVKKKNGFGGWSWQTRSLPGLPLCPLSWILLDPKSLTRDRAVLFTPLRVGWPPTPQVYFGP